MPSDHEQQRKNPKEPSFPERTRYGRNAKKPPSEPEPRRRHRQKKAGEPSRQDTDTPTTTEPNTIPRITISTPGTPGAQPILVTTTAASQAAAPMTPAGATPAVVLPATTATANTSTIEFIQPDQTATATPMTTTAATASLRATINQLANQSRGGGGE